MTQKDIKDIKIGTTDVNRLLYRFWEVWPILTTEHQKEWPFIVFTNFSTTDWADISFSIKESSRYGSGNLPNIEFSTDGINWNPVEHGVNYSYAINPYGKDLTDKIEDIYGPYAIVCNYLYFRGTNNISVDGLHIEVDQYEYKKWNGGIATYIRGYAEIHCFGNIMSLLDHSIIPTEIISDYCFAGLFSNLMTGLVEDQALKTANILYANNVTKGCYYRLFYQNTGLRVAPKLPATTLYESCYEGMFNNCDALSIAPELPATNIAASCYKGMFYGCGKITSAPELPATTLYESCYEDMFAGCPITTAPELPATNIAASCYKGMFYACTSLVTAPELPATTLYPNCYECMFEGCKSLVKAPELPATTLSERCYGGMFYSCSSLNYVKMLGVNAPDSIRWYLSYDKLYYWLDKVSSTGTFIKSKDATWDMSQVKIPSGWTIKSV